jgi:energy-coupling factor transporter transmembrane protein EcfT
MTVPFELHPAVRITCFLVLGAYLAMGRPLDLAVAAGVLAVLYGVLEQARLAPALTMLRRLRWFFLSILIIYFWFTPGTPIWPHTPLRYEAWLPTFEGIRLGLLGVAALGLFVFGVTLLLQTTPRNGLIAGIRWMVGALPLPGGFHDAFALRVALVLETVPKLQPVVQTAMPAGDKRGGAMERIGRTAAGLVSHAITEAQRAPPETIELPPDRRPPLLQWLWPAALGVLFWIV